MPVSAQELVEKLHESGTGSGKVDLLQQFLETEPRATAEMVIAHAERVMADAKIENVPARIGPGTVAKLRLIAEGKPIPVEVSRITRSSLNQLAANAPSDKQLVDALRAVVGTQLGPQQPNQGVVPAVGPVGQLKNDAKK